MTLNGVSVALAAVLSLALAWKWRREFATWKVEERTAAALMPFALFAALFLFVKTAFGGDGNTARLQPTFALAAALGLAAPEHPGPLLSPAGGPVAAAAYLPVLLFRTTTGMSVAAGFLTGVFLLLPLAWAHRSSGGHRPPFPVLAFLLSYVALFCFGGTAGLAFGVHAGAPAAGFGVLACSCLFSRGEEAPPGMRALLLSALFAALSLGCLPIGAPVALAPAAYLWSAWGLRWCGRYLLCFAGMGAGLAALLVPFFGPRELWVSCVTGPFGAPAGIRRSGEVFFLQAWPVLAGLVVLAALRAPQVAAEGARLRRGPWVLPFLAGAFTLPTSLIAWAKSGGRDPLLLALVYLVAALSLLLAGSAGSGGQERSRRLARALGVVLAGATLAFSGARVVAAWKG